MLTSFTVCTISREMDLKHITVWILVLKSRKDGVKHGHARCQPCGFPLALID